MTATTEAVRIPVTTGRSRTRYLRAAAIAVGDWFSRGQLGGSYESDVRSATGAR